MPRQKRPLPKNASLVPKNAKRVFSGKRFSIHQWEQKQFDGSTAIYEMAQRNDSVIVIPVIDNDVVFVEEKQAHWKTALPTLVAGMVNKGEDLAVAARRELEEETGLVFKKFDLAHVQESSPGMEWFLYTFIATGYAGEKEKNLDPGEQTKVMRVKFDKFINMVRNNEFRYPVRFVEEKLLRGEMDVLKKVLKIC